MTRDTRVQIVASVVLAACLAASGVLAVTLTGMAGRARLTYTDRAEAGQPVEQTVGIAMGAFRGIFVNFLWIRANEMKEAGKFFDAIQLASTITKLQPRFPRVWVFHAWNMAYNISVSTHTPQERWSWVNAGIRLLRDQGIPANPNDMLLHKELAWIYLHKIGGFTDDANEYYKRKLAQEWTIVLGPPPRKSGADVDRKEAIKKYVDWLRPLADAPESMEDCIKQEPGVGPLLERIRTQAGLSLATNDDSMTFLRVYEMQREVLKSVLREEYEQRMGPGPKAVEALVADPAEQKALAALVLHLRKQLVVERYHMDPERMIRYTQKYGPLDWRHHGAHGLYWAEEGVEVGEKEVTKATKADFDFVNTDRVVAQSIQDLFRTGEIYFDFLGSTLSDQSFFQGVPNPHFVESYMLIVDAEMRQRSDFDKTDNGGYKHIVYSPLSAGYENFVRDAILFFYRRGQVAKAEDMLRQLRTYRYTNLNDPTRDQVLSLPIREFVDHELEDNMTRPAILVQQVTGALMGAYASGLLGRDPEQFRSQMDYAVKAHRYFMEEQLRHTPAAGNAPDRMEQISRDFTRVAGTMFYQFIGGLDIDDAVTAYTAAPDWLQRYAYGPLKASYKELFDAAAKNGGKTFAQVFPQPPGFDEFLAQQKKEMEEQIKKQQNDAKVERQ